MFGFRSCTRLFYSYSSPKGKRMISTVIPKEAVRSTHRWSASVSHPHQYLTPHPLPTIQPKRGAKGKAGKKGGESESSKQVAEFDPNVCNGVNILKSGSDPLLKPDSEYPDWLWGLAEFGEAPKSPSELDTDSRQYWRRLNKVKAHEQNDLRKQFGRM